MHFGHWIENKNCIKAYECLIALYSRQQIKLRYHKTIVLHKGNLAVNLVVVWKIQQKNFKQLARSANMRLFPLQSPSERYLSSGRQLSRCLALINQLVLRHIFLPESIFRRFFFFIHIQPSNKADISDSLMLCASVTPLFQKP